MTDSELYVVVLELKDEKRSLENFTENVVNAFDDWTQISVVAREETT